MPFIVKAGHLLENDDAGLFPPGNYRDTENPAQAHGTMLSLVGEGEEYSIYHTGTQTLRIFDVPIKDAHYVKAFLPLGDLWEAFSNARDANDQFAFPYSADKDLFREYLTVLGFCDDVAFCEDCDLPSRATELAKVGSGKEVCGPCLDDDYEECGCCEKYWTKEHLRSRGRVTLDDQLVCEDCADSFYFHCEYCGGWYHQEDANEHDHDHDDGYDNCDCTSPQKSFAVGTLHSDEPVTVKLGAGTISDEGISSISIAIYRAGCAASTDEMGKYAELERKVFDDLGCEWQTKTGNYTKRLSRLAYKELGLKLPPELVSKVGNIAREHTQDVSEMRVEVSRELNASPGDWYHEDSCWWGSYSESRCALKTNGGFGLRSFASDSAYASVAGRAWVMPLKLKDDGRFTPTFDTTSADAFVVFNGYGNLSGYAGARVMAHLTGWTYRKVEFACSPMYVNAGGYLVAPEDVADDVTRVSLDLDEHSDLFYTEQAIARATEKELTHAA